MINQRALIIIRNLIHDIDNFWKYTNRYFKLNVHSNCYEFVNIQDWSENSTNTMKLIPGFDSFPIFHFNFIYLSEHIVHSIYCFTSQQT